MLDRVREAVSKFTSKKKIDKKDLEELIKEIQRALILGDVNVKVVFEISEEIKKKMFEEKPEKPKSTLASIGIYVFPADTLKFMKQFYKRYGAEADKSGNFIEWLMKKSKVKGFKVKGIWFDIGTKKELKKAREKFKNYRELFK